ncbi:MAG: site-2 protease family protein [Chloroflexi bacterium]|nr:site-2 protease family protein [Chloroflexota bacterium]
MSFLWAVGGFLLILTPLILIHEYGHFIAARLSKIRVEEFGLGFPPRAVTLFERNGTIFSLNWIPIGGFVRPAGEDNPDIPGGLASASKHARLFVLAAGSLANFVLAFVLFTIMFSLPQPVVNEALVAVSGVAEGSPAAVAGLEDGDVFVSVNSVPIAGDFEALTGEIQANLGRDVTLLMERDGEPFTAVLVPRVPGEYDASREGAVGVRLSHPATGEISSMGVPRAAVESVATMWNIVYMTVRMPVDLLAGQVAPEEARVVSVVGISQMAGQATQQTVNTGDITYILSLAGVISVALGFTNLLPIPALDGGRIIFVLIEAVRGRRVEPEYEGMVHAIGMILLLVLMVVLIVQDVVNPLPM